MYARGWLYTLSFPGAGLLRGCREAISLRPFSHYHGMARMSFCMWLGSYWTAAQPILLPLLHPWSCLQPREPLLTARMYLTTWAADHYQNRLAHRGTITQPTKSPCLGKEVSWPETHQTQGLADHRGSRWWLSSNPADQSDPAATWNTARHETSLASSSQPVLCLHGIWHKLVSHLELLITLISQIVMYLNDSWLLLKSHLQARKPPYRPANLTG